MTTARDRLAAALRSTPPTLPNGAFTKWADAILAADPALNAALSLGLAWAEVESLLPEGGGGWNRGRWLMGGVRYRPSLPEPWEAHALSRKDDLYAYGSTKEAALTNLADRLREKAR